MSLTTVYFPGEDEDSYRKCIVEADHVDFFISIGAARTPAQLKKVSDPDQGWGRPGSFEWHKSQISALSKNNDIVNYVEDVTGEKITNRGTPRYIRSLARKKIKRWLDAGQSE